MASPLTYWGGDGAPAPRPVGRRKAAQSAHSGTEHEGQTCRLGFNAGARSSDRWMWRWGEFGVAVCARAQPL